MNTEKKILEKILTTVEWIWLMTIMIAAYVGYTFIDTFGDKIYFYVSIFALAMISIVMYIINKHKVSVDD